MTMFSRLVPVFVVTLSLSSGWWGDIMRATAAAFGLYAPAAVERPTPPPPPDSSTTQSGCSIDPWGCPGG